MDLRAKVVSFGNKLWLLCVGRHVCFDEKAASFAGDTLLRYQQGIVFISLLLCQYYY